MLVFYSEGLKLWPSLCLQMFFPALNDTRPSGTAITYRWEKTSIKFILLAMISYIYWPDNFFQNGQKDTEKFHDISNIWNWSAR